MTMDAVTRVALAANWVKANARVPSQARSTTAPCRHVAFFCDGGQSGNRCRIVAGGVALAPSELINFAARRYAAPQTARTEATSLRRRMPAVFGLMIGLPISLLLWIVLILGVRALL